MSATDQMRQMINQLMGSDPQADAGDRMHFTDHRVCRSFLIGCCPHEVLASTRMDMGECPKYHDVALRADYEKAQHNKDFFYDLDALEHLERFFDDCDRKTEIAKKRLAETQEELSQEASEKADKVLELNEDIGKTLAEAERLGEEGKVDESLRLMEKVEQLRKAKQDADQEYRGAMPASSYQQQKLRVCEVCSAYLGIHDNDRRLADHFGGKLHMGFVFLREKLQLLRNMSAERRVKKEELRQQERGNIERAQGGGARGRDDDRRRGYGRNRSRSRSRDRSRGFRGSRDDRRDRRDDRDRDRDRKPSNRDRRSNSKDKRTDRSRSKEESEKSGDRNGKEEAVRFSDVDD